MAYGFEAYNPDGSTLISSTDGVARLIYSTDLAATYSGNISVPAFDSNLGVFYTRMYPYKHVIYLGVGYPPLAENSGWDQPSWPTVTISPSYTPTLSWNNSSKVLSITANSEAEDYYKSQIRYRYRLMMVHYR